MTHVLSLAAVIAAGFSFSALAAEGPTLPSTDLTAVAAHSAQLSVAANAQQVRQILLAQGYTNVSDLNRDESGRWIGTALKDGKTVAVAVALPRQATQANSASNPD